MGRDIAGTETTGGNMWHESDREIVTWRWRRLVVLAAAGFVMLLAVGMGDLLKLEEGRTACRTVPFENQALCNAGARSIFGRASERRLGYEATFAAAVALHTKFALTRISALHTKFALTRISAAVGIGAVVTWQLERRARTSDA